MEKRSKQNRCAIKAEKKMPPKNNWRDINGLLTYGRPCTKMVTISAEISSRLEMTEPLETLL
jgi:hypothetical protein